MTLDEYFVQWFETVRSRASNGWRKEQLRMYKVYVSPIIGKMKVESITPQLVAKVINEVASKGKSEQTQLHVFSLLRKLFGDAIELFRLLTYNPAQRTLRPKVAVKETPHLNLSQIKALLRYVEEKPYGLAIWLQLYLGLRIGELQVLTWSDVDLDDGILTIRRAYVRIERIIKDYPKGRRHHSHMIPLELLEKMRQVRKLATSSFVVTSASGEMLSYEWYFRSLRRYCKELGIASVGTHGLRHSTPCVYLSHGASKDDIRQLFAHSSSEVTERYIHHRGSNLEKVAKVIKLFSGSSQNLPKSDSEKVDTIRNVVLNNCNHDGFQSTGA